jgi:hypothetical protein
MVEMLIYVKDWKLGMQGHSSKSRRRCKSQRHCLEASNVLKGKLVEKSK